MSAPLHRDKVVFVLICLFSLILSSCLHPDPYQAALEGALGSSGTVGAVAAVLDGDTPLWQGAAGWSDPVAKVPHEHGHAFQYRQRGQELRGRHHPHPGR